MAWRRRRIDSASGDPGTETNPPSAALSRRLAQLIETSPAVRDTALEVGLVDPHWLAEPAQRKPAIAPPYEVLRRFLERAVEAHPSALAGVGVNALQVLSWDLFWDRGLLRSHDSVSTATIAFTDLEGFTRYTSTHGDDAARTLLAEHQRATTRVVRQWGGRIVKHLGDGLLLVFPEAASAVQASLELLSTAPAPLRLRAGLHTGPLVVTADDVVGNVVNVAARITNDAKGGEVLASRDTTAAAGVLPGVRFSRARRRSYKGVDGRVEVCRVTRD